MPGCDGPGTRECWFRCCGSLVSNGSRSCASVEVPCREGVCCPALVGTLLREEQWNRNPVSCAEPLLCCSCVDHGRLRGIRGIPAQCACGFVTAWQSSVFEWLRDGSSAVPRGLSCVAGWCRSQAIRCAQGRFRFRGSVPNRGFLGQSGVYRCSPVPVAPAVPYRAVPLRCCARCSPLYWLLPAKTQLPPYGGLRRPSGV